MSTRTLKKNSISMKNMDYESVDKLWTRPLDWLALPTIGASDQKCAMLVAIYNTTANYVAFSATGNYTVDWGDGISENVNTGVTAQHRYNWADISNTTLTSEGFRQALVIVTPQAGQTLTNIDFQKRHTDVTIASAPTPWLDIKIGITGSLILSNYISSVASFPLLKILTIENHTTNLTSTWLRGNAENVAQVYINKPGLNISSSGPFQYSDSLEYIWLHPTTTGSDCSNLFLFCTNLREAPYFNTAAVTNMSSMFQGCYKLRKVPLYNTSNVTNMSNMFSTCESLREIPLFDMVKVTNCTYMFSSCYALQQVPAFNIGGANCNAEYMFNSCHSLTKIPLINVSTINNATNLFTSCFSLKEIAPLTFNNLAGNTNMFSGCSVLEYIPNIFTRSLGLTSTFSSVFNLCESLKTLPNIPFAAGNTSTNFGTIPALREFPSLNMQFATSSINFTTRVFRSQLYNVRVTISYQNNMLDKVAINEVINNLITASTTQTLTITGNPGANINPALSRASGTTTGSTTVTCSNTASFEIGTQVTGTGISDAISVTFTDTGDTVTLVNHGIPNGKLVSFTAITTTTGIVVFTPYFVVNATTDTFQLSLTEGGGPIALTNNGTGTMIYQTLVTAINPNVSVTIDIPASATGSPTLSYRNLNTQLAVMKRFTVTG